VCHNCFDRSSFHTQPETLSMTECNQESFAFEAHFSRRVEAGFTGGQITSDGGALLLREAERKINLLRLAGCFTDKRAADRVEHPLRSMPVERNLRRGLARVALLKPRMQLPTSTSTLRAGSSGGAMRKNLQPHKLRSKHRPENRCKEGNRRKSAEVQRENARRRRSAGCGEKCGLEQYHASCTQF
jgi:hypothetical protein